MRSGIQAAARVASPTFRRTLAVIAGVAWGLLAGPGAVRGQGLAPMEAPSRVVWIAAQADAFGDGSSAAFPLDGSTPARLDRVFAELQTRFGDYGPGLHVRFLPGEYETGGLSIRPNWWLEGDAMETTVLRRVATDRDRRTLATGFNVISGGWLPQKSGGNEARPGRDYVNVRVAHLTLDANWAGLREALGTQVKKAAGLALFCRQAEIGYVKVVHFGALGGRATWREVFPIIVRSMAKVFPERLTGPPSSSIEIHHCVVEGRVEGPERFDEYPYCTGILVGHEGADPENAEVRAHVHHNEIRDVINGIAFGGAWMRSGVFEHNRVVRCGVGFNFDAGGNRGVIIRNNEFDDCIGGGRVYLGSRFLIESNVFRLRHDVQGKYAGWNHGVRLQDYTTFCEVRGNRFEVVDGTSPNPEAATTGVYVHGRGIGVRWLEDPPGTWQHLPERHVIEGNETSPLLRNRIVTAKPGDWLYVRVDGRDIDLSGWPNVADGAEFEW